MTTPHVTLMQCSTSEVQREKKEKKIINKIKRLMEEDISTPATFAKLIFFLAFYFYNNCKEK